MSIRVTKRSSVSHSFFCADSSSDWYKNLYTG